MPSIQAFWFVAVAVAERTAISPVQLRGEVARPVGHRLADEAEVGLVDEDVVGADGGAGVVADDLDAGGLGGRQRRDDRVRVGRRDRDRADALGRRVLDERDLGGSVAVLGPTWVTVPPSSPAALSAPTFAASKYGLLICLGMNVTFRAAGGLAGCPGADAAARGCRRRSGGAAVDALGGRGCAAPQAPTAMLAVANRAAIRPNRRVDQQQHLLVCHEADYLTRAANRWGRSVPIPLRSVDGVP